MNDNIAGPAIRKSQIYTVLANLVMHSEQVRWTRLYNLLVVNTLLVLAWVAVFTSSGKVFRQGILICLSLPGFLFSILWAGLGARSSAYLDDFHKEAENLEQEWPAEYPKPFAVSQPRRSGLRRGIHRFTSSRWLVTWIPIFFAAIFFVFTVVAVLDS
jgi:hypothetical protein